MTAAPALLVLSVALLIETAVVIASAVGGWLDGSSSEPSAFEGRGIARHAYLLARRARLARDARIRRNLTRGRHR